MVLNIHTHHHCLCRRGLVVSAQCRLNSMVSVAIHVFFCSHLEKMAFKVKPDYSLQVQVPLSGQKLLNHPKHSTAKTCTLCAGLKWWQQSFEPHGRLHEISQTIDLRTLDPRQFKSAIVWACIAVKHNKCTQVLAKNFTMADYENLKVQNVRFIEILVLLSLSSETGFVDHNSTPLSVNWCYPTQGLNPYRGLVPIPYLASTHPAQFAHQPSAITVPSITKQIFWMAGALEISYRPIRSCRPTERISYNLGPSEEMFWVWWMRGRGWCSCV